MLINIACFTTYFPDFFFIILRRHCLHRKSRLVCVYFFFIFSRLHCLENISIVSPFHISVHIPKIIHCCYILVLNKMNFLTLASQIPDKQASVLFLPQRRVLDNSKICANGHQMTLQRSDNGARWRCRWRQCRTESGLRIGTWLEHSRLPYRDINLFIYCWAYEMTSIQSCERELLMNKYSC